VVAQLGKASMTPWQFVQYVALKQLDAFAGDGVARTMGGFTKLADERDEYADLMFQSYAEGAEDLDPADWGEEAREQALDYYQLLLNLRQSILNLLAAGLYHLYEQHRETVIDLLKQDRRTLPPLQNLTGWTKVEELRLLANTVKPPGSVLAQACVRVVRCHEAGWELVARVPSALGHGAKGVTGEGWGGRGRLEGRHHPHQLLPATG
jgi:hypothetical protein